jgi:hypothetical protein
VKVALRTAKGAQSDHWRQKTATFAERIGDDWAQNCLPTKVGGTRIKSQRTDCLKAIRKDFLKLQKAAKKEGWTRDTPVPLGFFGE